MKPCSISPEAGDHGFSILEMLIALALLAMIMSTMVGALDFVGRSWNLIESRVRLSAAEDAMRFLERQIGAAAPIMQAPPPFDGAFEGQPQMLSYLALSEVKALGAGVFKFELSFEPSDSENASKAERLILQVRPLDPVSEKLGKFDGERYVVLDNIRSHTLRYFGKTASPGVSEWTSHWTSKNEFPELVSIRLKVPDGTYDHDLLRIVELPLRPPPK